MGALSHSSNFNSFKDSSDKARCEFFWILLSVLLTSHSVKISLLLTLMPEFPGLCFQAAAAGREGALSRRSL